MLFGIIDTLKGNYTVHAEGRFPERVLNILTTRGIYVHDVIKKDASTLEFSVSRKAYEKIAGMQFEGINITLTEKRGLPVFLRRYKKRLALILLPLTFLLITGVLSRFIWRVEIEGGDAALRKEVRKVIKANGVYTGALKSKIDRYETKRNAILEIDNLAWLWVDVKGTTASVKVRPRTEKPTLLKINEPSDVISLHTGVIEKMQVYCGIPLFTEGMTVEKGQVVVTGVLRSENENIPTYYHHACADITLRVDFEKTFVIPKKTIKKVPTGKKKSVFGINFKKNKIKFSLNSGISYTDYDKIEKTIKIPLLPISFTKTTYLEADVVEEDTVISERMLQSRQSFEESLRKQDIKIISTDETVSEDGDYVRLTLRAQGLVRADKEVPITENLTP